MVAFSKDFSHAQFTPDSLVHAERIHGNFSGLTEFQGLKSRMVTGRNGRFPYDSCLSPSLAQGRKGSGGAEIGGQIRGPAEGAGPMTNIEFNGSTLNAYDAEGKVVGVWSAGSGRPGSMSPDLQHKEGLGPIPEGQYSVNQADYQSRSVITQFLGAFGKGTWPGNANSWGDHRIWVYPLDGTNTFGRSGFTIHGGKFMGSAGCIDLTSGMPSFVEAFQGGGQDAVLTVGYGGPRP